MDNAKCVFNWVKVQVLSRRTGTRIKLLILYDLDEEQRKEEIKHNIR